MAKNRGWIRLTPYLMTMGKAPAIKIVIITKIIP
ncbi:unnamed protein product, partial [marine sediment metagenome]